MKIPFTDYHIIAFLKGAKDAPLPLDILLQNYFRTHKSLGSKDRKVISDTIFGMTRWKTLVENSSFDPASQLQFYKDFEKGGFKPPSHLPKYMQLATSKFLYEKFKSLFGESKGEELLETLNTQAPTFVRVNALKTTRSALVEKWKDKFSFFISRESPNGLQFRKREPLFSLPEFQEGLFEVQDEGSQIVANLVKAKPGDLILDYCSGSGGKTLAFAPSMEGKGQIYLHDIRPIALTQAKKRLKRAGIQNAQCVGSNHPQLKALKGKCHWVLIDVPCTGSGTLRRNPDQKWKIDEAMLERLIKEQRSIAEEAISYLHPKGRLVYATCSLFPDENEDQVDYFLKTLPLTLESPVTTLPPKLNGMDGFFAAVFTKKELMV